MREENIFIEKKITTIFEKLKNSFPQDWLLVLELYEIALENNFSNKTAILSYLKKLQENKTYKKLIQNGLDLLKTN